MRNIIYFSVFFISLFVLTFLSSQNSYAQGCPVVGSTPGGGEVVECNGVEVNGVFTTDQNDEVTINPGSDITSPVEDVIDTFAGNDVVRMFGGTVSGDSSTSECIELGLGRNEFYMFDGQLLCEHGVRSASDADSTKIVIEDGLIEAEDECLNPGNSPDEIYISGGILNCDHAIIQTRDGDDIVVITGGILTQTTDEDQGVETGEDNDMISVSHAIVDGSIAKDRHAIDGGADDDTVKLGTGAEILGLSTGNEGFDTLVFEMGVTETSIPSLCSQILAMDPEEGEITINGLFYEWEDFEVILCELVPSEPRPIPTLSQWGMIAMAGVLGLVGFMVIRRRNAVA